MDLFVVHDRQEHEEGKIVGIYSTKEIADGIRDELELRDREGIFNSLFNSLYEVEHFVLDAKKP